MLNFVKVFPSVKPLFCFKSLAIVLLFIFHAVPKAESVEIINHNNIYSGISGIYSSTHHGIVFSNSLGVYSIDKESGAIKNIEFDFTPYYAFSTFFEIEGVLYFYRLGGDMFKMKEGRAVQVAYNVVEHYVKDDKIYLIRSREPRIEVITSTQKESYSIGDEKGSHLFADYIEINGDIFGFMRLNWTATTVIFKMTDDGPEYIISSESPDYEQIKQSTFMSIKDVQGEIWINGGFSNHRLVGNELLPWDEQFTFSDSYVRDFYYENGMLYVLTMDHIIRADLATKDETILHTLPQDMEANVCLFKGNNVFYLVIGNSIFIYDPEKDTYEEHQTLINNDIRVVAESEKGELLVAKLDRIEWYTKPEPTVFSKNGPYLNTFIDIDYDTKNNKIVALGQNGVNFIIQEYDGENWNSFDVPFSIQSEYLIPSFGFNVDNNGNYLLSINEFLGKWDGDKWERISALDDISGIEQSEEYQIYCRDSSGALWLGASISKYYPDSHEYITSNEFWRYYDGKFQVMVKYIKESTYGMNKRGICMRDGTIRIDLASEYIYDINGDLLSKIFVTNGIDSPFTNTSRYISVNKNNELIVNFKETSGWTSKYGDYSFEAGHSIYYAGNWNHFTYNNLIFQTGLRIFSSFITFDTYENDWIISDQYFLKITEDDVEIFYPPHDIVKFAPSLDNVVQIGNTIWFVSRMYGLFEMKLPKATSVDTKNLAAQPQYILNPIVSDTHLELSEQIDSYEIYTIKGQRLLDGQNDKFIDVQHISNGAYFMVGKANSKIFVNKFLISR